MKQALTRGLGLAAIAALSLAAHPARAASDFTFTFDQPVITVLQPTNGTTPVSIFATLTNLTDAPLTLIDGGIVQGGIVVLDVPDGAEFTVPANSSLDVDLVDVGVTPTTPVGTATVSASASNDADLSDTVSTAMTIDVVAAPEPSQIGTLALLGLGLGGLVLRARRKTAA